MDIKILGGNGLHASETRAVRKMGETLRSSWFGYASLLVADDQGSMDVDTLIITHDRLLLVELKEWNGKLESSEGRWYLNGSPRGKSPYEIKRVQALRISKLLQKELEHKLGYFPRVEAHVVLCGTATPECLSTSERRFVHTLDEFLKISDTTEYNRIAEAAASYTNLFDRYGKPRPNSATSKPILESFFAGNRVRPKEFTHFSYTAEPHPWFKHRKGLFTEYKGHHQEATNDVALMRRWDFSALGVGSATQDQWSRIALRESRVFSHAKDHERGLEEYLLRPLVPLSIDDVSEDLTELYELRRTFSRLDEHLSKNGKTLTPDDRLDLVRAIVAPFAELHGLGIAHRDVDLHNLWHASEQKSVLISGFAASFFPERGTVSDLREILQGSYIRLPEDEFHLAGDILDPFRQDVFMLGAAAYRVLFPASPLPKDEQGIWQWSQPSEDPYDGQLDQWLKTALSWEATDRFGNATEMLATLNEAVKPTAPNEEEAASTWQSIADGEFIKRGWGPFQIFQNFPPNPSEDPGSGQVIRYRCTVGGEPALLKFWQNVAPNATTHGLNRRLVAFRSKAEKVAAGGIPTPSLIDLGLLESGGLYVVTRLEPGESWRISSTEKSLEHRRQLAHSLIKAVMILHDQQLGHGDIHPENLLVYEAEGGEQSATSPAVLLLDMLDFGEQAQPFNVEYGPTNPAAADAFARDRFAVYRLVEELLCDETDVEFKKELSIGCDQPLGIPVSLEPLYKEVQRLLKSSLSEESVPNLDPICIVPFRAEQAADGFMLEQDEGGYHFNCRWDSRSSEIMNCYVTGMNGSITFVVDPEQRQLRDVRLRTPIALSDLVSASNKSTAAIPQPLKIVQTSAAGNGHKEVLDLLLGLDPVVSLLEERFAPKSMETNYNEADIADATTEDIWRALLDTEQESLLELEVTGTVEENRNGKLQVPYRSVDGRPMDFESDDRVLVRMGGDDTDFAVLDILETTPDELFLEATRADAKRRLRPGSILRLESIQNKAPRDRKAKAMERVLDRASVIPDLASYFNPASSVTTKKLSESPVISQVKELYDTEDQKLNPRQIQAFVELVERGPVGVLQGPPGTGKTTFVGAFIHYLFSELGVRNILLVGQSHTAVDAVAMKTRSMCSRHEMPLSVVRMGQERMLATGMLDAHSRAIQRQMRHTFHREYEHRIEVFSSRLGLPVELTAEIAALHRTLDGLLASIRRYEAELATAQSQSANDELRLRAPDIQNQLDEVKSLRDRIVHQRFHDSASTILATPDPWGTIVDQVAESHGVNNPSAISRLRSLLSLSQEWLSVLHAGQSNYDQFLVQTRQLVCGTLVGMGKKELGVAETEFDWVIVDEAARAQASELMIPLQSGRRILLVGDHRQLPPFYERSHVRAASRKIHVSEERIRKTDFERAFQVTQGVTLDTQYRMIDPIGNLVSECFYKDDGVQLNTGRGDSPEWFSGLPYPLNTPVTWLDSGSGVDATGEEEQGAGSYRNVHEAKLTMRLLQRLARPDTINRLKSNANGALHPIGVITMYRGQKTLLEKELSKAEWAASIRSLIRIDTVDSYQGQENPFIILSLVRDNISKKQGFMVDPSRINVSLSRAQERLVVVGAARMWQSRNRADPLGKVLSFIEERCASGNNKYTIARDLPEFVFSQENAGVAENA